VSRSPPEGRPQRSPIGPERLAHRGYVNLERICLDDRARPHTSHELVLGDELTARLRQNRKDLERAAPEGNRDSMRAQFMPREIQLPPVKLVHQVLALFRHARQRLGVFSLCIMQEFDDAQSLASQALGPDVSLAQERCFASAIGAVPARQFLLRRARDASVGVLRDGPRPEKASVRTFSSGTNAVGADRQYCARPVIWKIRPAIRKDSFVPQDQSCPRAAGRRVRVCRSQIVRTGAPQRYNGRTGCPASAN
jgi:hypothetical protein